MSTSVTLSVVAGQQRQVVGRIEAQAGMLTSIGRIERVTPQTVFFEGGEYRRNLDDVTVRHTEARRFGYPKGKGCTRIEVRYIRRGETLIAA